MPLFPADFKKFKHLSSDDKTTTLQHPGGHTITIMHKALSPNMRKQLEAIAMAQGGIIDKAKRSGVLGTQPKVTQEIEEGDAKYKHMQLNAPKDDGVDVRTPEQKEKAKAAAKAYGYAQGGEICMAEGGEVQEADLPSKIGELVGKYGINPLVNAVKAVGQEGGQAVHDVLQGAGRFTQGVEKAVGIPVGQQPQVPAQTPIDASQSMPQPEQEAQGIAPQPMAPEPEVPQGPDTQGMLQKAYNEAQAGVKQQGQAQDQLAQDQSAALAKSQEAQAKIQQDYQSHVSELEAERQNLIQDVQDGYVNPEKYWSGDKNGNGGHSKIMAGIGMILAGFNPTNSPNAAINYLKFQMEQNLQAQKENLDSKQSLLAANMRQFGNIKEAMDMTRVMQADMVKNQLEQASAKASSPLAKAAALQAAGQIDKEYAPLFQQVAQKTAMNKLMGQAGKDPSKLEDTINAIAQVDPEKAKDLRSRLIPNVGFANTPDDAKYLKEVQDRQINIKKNAEDVLKMVKAHGTYEMFGPHNAELEQRIDQIATDMAKMQDPTSAARPGEVEMVKKSLLNPGITTNDKTAQDQLKAFYKTVEQRANQAFSTRGVQAPQTQLEEVKTLNGVKYKKVSGGWQRVK